MDTERDEVYERIPWETLEKKGGDRQWMVYVVAGAVALGALAYSFTRNQPVGPAASAPSATATTIPTPVATTAPANAVPSTVASPVVVAEADLYAVDPERIVDQAAAHAEWFAVEYFSVDPAESSETALASLLPAGIPMPTAVEGTQVFVDWAGATEVTEVGPMSYEVSVVVRSLLSADGGGFVRQPAQELTVPVEVIGEGPRISGVPAMTEVVPVPQADMALQPVPEEVIAALEGQGEVVGGRPTSDGGWAVVVMVAGPDGVTRPVTLRP